MKRFLLLLLLAAGGLAEESRLEVEALPFGGREAAIEEVRAALSQDSYPWYDAQADSLRMPAPPKQADAGKWRETLALLVNAVITALIICAIIVMGWVLYRKRPSDRSSGDNEDEAPDEALADSAMALPPELAAHAGNFLAAAERAAAAGDYRLAICCLFHHLLTVLGEAGLIRLARGRTNRQYLRQLAEHPSRPPLTDAMRLFEGVYFGGHAADSAMWEKMRSSQQFIERLIARPKPLPQLAVAIVAGLLLLGGCGEGLNTFYGSSTDDSINGTRVFRRMLEARGHKVFIWEPEGPAQQADCYVMFAPRRAYPPFFDFFDEPDSQVVVVNQDFDAAVHLWDDVGTIARQRGQMDLAAAADDAKFAALGLLLEEPPPAFCSDQRDVPAILMAPETGELAPMSLRDAGLYLNFHWSEAEESLLVVDGSPMVERLNETVISVANGSFLLNYSLLNDDRRVLAVRLADQLGSPRRIAFVEGRLVRGGSANKIRRGDFMPLLRDPAIRRVFGHLLLLAVMWLLMQSPILGKPRRRLLSAVHHFSAHLRAYASLLYRSGDRAHADALIDAYENPGAPHE
jgi:hypothetical protein